MGEQRALEYFRTLSELMVTMEATDGRAVALSLDHAALAHFITDRAKSIAASQPTAEVGV